jgi:predicted ATP-dependent protease
MNYDDNFDRLFKITADFNSEIPRNEENEFKYASFIGSKCVEDGLLHLDRKAVSKVIEHSSWLIEDQFMLSTNFSKIVDLLVEADYLARNENRKVISIECIEETIKKIDYRLKKENEEFQRWIKENIIYIKTTSSLVGEINGLTVLTTGEYSFGLPVRITAKTYVGDLGIVNIEREVKMSGEIHDKGVMTLSGYLGNIFGQDKPLSFEASITFEQQYYHIDGDSASSTELYAILSSLSGIPIKQNIAVTGSVNQNGEIQPIGGVNDKIEGFYSICKHRGFDNNGVMIPKSNVRNLMLKQEIIDASKRGDFTIYAIDTIEEGIEILTGVKAGSIEEEGTIFNRVNRKLEDFYSSLKDDKDERDCKEDKE